MRALAPVLLALAILVSGCGGGEEDAAGGASKGVTYPAAIESARAVQAADFPAPGSRNLQDLAGRLRAINVALATSVFEPGTNRLAFGLLDQRRKFVYGKTAVYLARSTTSKVLGPFVAPADPLIVAPAYRSQNAVGANDDVAAVYDARLRLPSAGKWYVLAMVKVGSKTFGGATQIKVTKSSPVPSPGDPAPATKTDTKASARGDMASIDTRRPFDDMHSTDLASVRGKKPVALVFATPQLCESRVCGPVVDIAAQLETKYRDRMQFIHQEVFVGNDIKKGLRPPLRRFGLSTEPWLFTIDRRGRVAARLEGSFGNDAFEKAIKAAL